MNNAHEAYQSPLDQAGVDISTQHEIANGMEAERNALSEARAKQIAKAVMTRETLESVLTMNDLHGLAISEQEDRTHQAQEQKHAENRINDEKNMAAERERTDKKYPFETLQMAAQDIDAVRDEFKNGDREGDNFAQAQAYHSISKKVDASGKNNRTYSADTVAWVNRERASVLDEHLDWAEKDRIAEKADQEHIMQKRIENDRRNTPETLQGTAIIANETNRTSTEDIDFINSRVSSRGFGITREVMQRMKKQP